MSNGYVFSPTDVVMDVVRAEGGSFVFGEVEFKTSFKVDVEGSVV